MQVNKSIATEMMPPILVAITILLLVGRTATGIYERINPNQYKCRDLVEWREPKAGLAESKATGKSAILYFINAAHAAKDEEYKRLYFSEPKIAAQINANYIPIKIYDKALGAEKSDPVVQEMQDKYLQWYTQPAIHALPVELQQVHNEKHVLPHFYPFEVSNGRKMMYSFLDVNKNWHPMPVAPSSDVKWTKIEEAQSVAKQERKPILFFFAQLNDSSCNEAMHQLFTKKQCTHEVLKKYVCCMVFDHSAAGNKNSTAVDNLLKKYKVSTYPTFVVDKAAIFGQNDKVIGYLGHDTMEEFLKTNLANLTNKDCAASK